MTKEATPELYRYETTLHGQTVTVRRFETVKYQPPKGRTIFGRSVPREFEIMLDDLTTVTKELDTVSLADVLAEEETNA